jgi:flagellar basal body rod protein FlgG
MTKQAAGTFDVKLVPQPQEDKVGDPTIGRMSIDKVFHGDLQGTSRGQMLAAGTDVKNSAGYVALERIDGTLHGRTGTFALQHSGTMTRGDGHLMVTVVPDSASGQLAGLAGRMSITIDGGKHSYAFEYTLPDPSR